MSSSFSSASSSSSSLFSYAYAYVAASLFSASFGHTFWRPWTAFSLHFGSLWAPLEPLWAPLGTTWATMLTQGCKWAGSSGALGQLRFQLGVPFGAVFEPTLNNFFENLLPKTIPQPNAFFIRCLSNFNDPRTLIFELSPARERNSQKTT